ncbi:phage baseplate protein [Pectobacterium carotovorum]|uniref:phage baseplate protein n=1 Tax=Pectobacterium carotovorum TaxID=554 RepID=UPI003017E875
MSIVGVFDKSRPEIGGIFFDAILEESSELRTDVSEYPLETGQTANDNAVTRPMTVTMTVAISDNPVKALMAEAGQFSGIAGIGAGVAVGAVGSILGGGAAALAGLAASAGLAFAASGSKRSESALLEIRKLQVEKSILTVVGVNSSYDDMIITNTRVQKNKQNEGGQEIVVEMRALLIKNRNDSAATTNRNLPAGDSAATQGQVNVNLGEVTPQ